MGSASSLALIVMICTAVFAQSSAQRSPKPTYVPFKQEIPDPRDRIFDGLITLQVDATDTAHGYFRVEESIPLQTVGQTVLLYPEWDPASHGPTASAIELAGLQMKVEGRDIEWRRDPRNVHAFRVTAPPGAHELVLTFDYLPLRSAARLRPDFVAVEWLRLVLYPAGWYARDIRVAASLRIPEGLHAFTSLTQSAASGGAPKPLTFAPETLDRLLDAPVYAARYSRRIELAGVASVPIHLDLVADKASDLEVSSQDLEQLKRLVTQTARAFGPAPFRHYDMLVSLSDVFSPGGGIEHLEEGENDLPANYFTASDQQLNNRDLIAHEYVHAWNGRFRQPAGLWSPDFNHPTDSSLLWVYEGQTEFWGRVLAARAGMRTQQQTLDRLALDAAVVEGRSGRKWKSLADSTLDALYMPGHAVPWRDWQRREDYYPEGVLLWIDIDARLRELSHGRYGLDDFSREFFATSGRLDVISPYTFDDVCKALEALAPADWRAILQQHLSTHDDAIAVSGLERAGWKITYSSTPTETFLQDERESDIANLDLSLGLQIASNGIVRSVTWNGPAFQAGLAPGQRVTAVNRQPYSRAAVLSATGSSANQRVQLSIEDRGVHRELTIPYEGPLRYPHLERISGTEDRLTLLLQPR